MAKLISLVERTAKAAFNLDGQPVRVGQIVTLNATQLRNLIAADCVAATDRENAELPVAVLPPTQAAPTVVLGDKGQIVELTDEEAAKLAGIDADLPPLVRAGNLGGLNDDQWAKLITFDARFGDLRAATPVLAKA